MSKLVTPLFPSSMTSTLVYFPYPNPNPNEYSHRAFSEHRGVGNIEHSPSKCLLRNVFLPASLGGHRSNTCGNLQLKYHRNGIGKKNKQCLDSILPLISAALCLGESDTQTI